VVKSGVDMALFSGFRLLGYHTIPWLCLQEAKDRPDGPVLWWRNRFIDKSSAPKGMLTKNLSRNPLLEARFFTSVTV
jgi:hypothetical protein